MTVAELELGAVVRDATAQPASDEDRVREHEARFSMLEKLADYDDVLMEQLLEDVEPPRDRVFGDLSRELREGHVVPVLIGLLAAGRLDVGALVTDVVALADAPAALLRMATEGSRGVKTLVRCGGEAR